jgi:STE24 endopeptidase
LGFEKGDLAVIFVLVLLLEGLVTFWLSPLLSAWSRHHEYQADAFAALEGGKGPRPLVRALLKLEKKNLGNLYPHPAVSAFYDSHPPLIQRIHRLESLKG